MEKKVLIVGHVDHGRIHALSQKFPNVEIISPEQARERGLPDQPPASKESFPIHAYPALEEYPIFTPPITRKERRKRERDAKKRKP